MDTFLKNTFDVLTTIHVVIMLYAAVNTANILFSLCNYFEIKANLSRNYHRFLTIAFLFLLSLYLLQPSDDNSMFVKTKMALLLTAIVMYVFFIVVLLYKRYDHPTNATLCNRKSNNKYFNEDDIKNIVLSTVGLFKEGELRVKYVISICENKYYKGYYVFVNSYTESSDGKKTHIPIHHSAGLFNKEQTVEITEKLMNVVISEIPGTKTLPFFCLESKSISQMHSIDDIAFLDKIIF